MSLEPISLTPIGIIRTPFATKESCPVQGVATIGTEGTVELRPELAEGLKDIELFTHVYLLYHLHLAGKVELVRQPFLDDSPHGIFATRHPCRPNGIGLSIVRVGRHEGNRLQVLDVDMLDGTPLLDIKPLVPKFDARPGASNGWVAGESFTHKPAGRE